MKNKIIAVLLACSLMATALCACSALESKSSKKDKDDDAKTADKDDDEEDEDEEEEETEKETTTVETTKFSEHEIVAPETTAPPVVIPEPVYYDGDSAIEYLDLIANECYGADLDTAKSYLEDELNVSLSYGTEPDFSSTTYFSVSYYYVEYYVDLYIGDMYFDTLSICYLDNGYDTVYDIGFIAHDLTADEASDFYNDYFNECCDLWEIDANDPNNYWSQTTYFDDYSNQVYIMGGSWGEPASDTSYTYMLAFEDHSSPYYLG